MPKVPKLNGSPNSMYNVYVYPGLDIKKQVVFRRKAGISKKILTYEEILNVVSDVYDVSVKDILGKSRLHKIMKARTCAQAIIKQLLGYSYSEIADIFKLCNHTATLHNIRKSNNWLKVYPGYARDYNVAYDYCKELQEQYENVRNNHVEHN